jgi:hypothetical protein
VVAVSFYTVQARGTYVAKLDARTR